jgi:hypothetical protein
MAFVKIVEISSVKLISEVFEMSFFNKANKKVNLFSNILTTVNISYNRMKYFFKKGVIYGRLLKQH